MTKRIMLAMLAAILLLVTTGFAQQDAAVLEKEINEKIARLKEITTQMESSNSAQYKLLREDYDKLKAEIDALKGEMAQLQAAGDKIARSKKAVNDGNRALKRGRYKEALTFYNEAIALDSTQSKAYYGKAYALQALKKYADSEKAFKKTLDLEPGNVKARRALGKLYRNLDKPLQAIDQYKKALEYDSTDAKSYYEIGYTYNKLKDYNNAASAFKSAYNLNANYDKALEALGAAFIELKQFQKAVDPLQKVIALKPRHKTAYLRLAIVYNNLGQYQNAMDTAQKAIQLGDSNIRAAANIELGKAYKMSGDKAKAKAAFQDAARNNRYRPTAEYEIKQLNK